MKIHIPEPFRQARAAVLVESVSIGYDTIALVPDAEIERAQLGYAIVPDDLVVLVPGLSG